MNKIKKKFLILFLAMVVGIIFVMPARAAGTSVTDLQSFKNAINNGEDVTIANDILITETVEIPATYKGTIMSDSKTLSLGDGAENMFAVSSGADVSFENIIFDGQEHGRIFDAEKATLSIKNSTLKNATTEPFKQNIINEKDTQRYEGGAIYAEHTKLKLEGTNFEKNHTKSVVPSPGAPHGGAIVSYSADITISGGEFKDNYTGKVDKEFSSHGEGGAIKLHPGSILTINDPKTTKKDTTIFDGNHLDSLEDKGGRQGGAIEATQSKAYIYGATFKIPGPFNTGGAIKFEGCDEAVVNNSHFETLANKGDIGVAGGAITSENSKLSIDSSSFKTNAGSRVREAGGLIQVVGAGTFNLTNSELEGSGAWFNGGKDGLFTANTGGAVNFYDASSVKAVIDNTTIKNFMVDGAGAGISLAKAAGHEASVTLTMTNTTIENTAAYVWQATAHGGAMFVGKGNTVTINGGKISSQTASNNAGGIFNEGSVTITGSDKGPAQITGNLAYQMVGGIYNDGYLKVDKANFSGNKRGDWSTGDGHVLRKEEMGGINIYADKDVIITPEAVFDGNDIRVLDGQSKVILTGALKNQINVSISENVKKHSDPKSIIDRYSETQERYIGYTVAAGTDNYKPTPEDAQKFHYVSKDTSQAIAEPGDHTSIGKWDYVFNPEKNTVVLGQRAKMIYHANYDDKNAKFKDESKEKDQIYTFYATGGGEPGVSIDNIKADYLQELNEVPVSRWIFDGWYNHKPKQPTLDDACKEFRNTKKNAAGSYKVNFAEAYFFDTKDKITTIVDPNELHVYAGWKPLDITISKVWDDDNAKEKAQSATLILTPGKASNAEETFNADRNQLSKTYEELDKFKEDGTTPIDYSLDEPAVPEGYTKTIKPLNNSNPKEDTISASVTNTKRDKVFKVVHEFKVADGITLELPDAIKNWTPEDQKDKADGTRVTPSDFTNKEYKDTVNKGKWTFDSWDKTEDTINGADVKFIGTWTFKKTETPEPKPTLYKVVHEFKVADGITLELPDAIKKWTPEDQKDKADGTKVTPSDFTNKEYKDTVNKGKWTFDSWDKPEDTINGADVKFIGTWTFKKDDNTDPKDPDKPDKPDQPTVPDKPNKPDQPTVPDKPNKPGKPIVPEKPDKPTVPGNPLKPDSPINPQKPTGSENANEANKSDVKKTNTGRPAPQTGENNGLVIYTLVTLVSASSFIAIANKRRKNEK